MSTNEQDRLELFEAYLDRRLDSDSAAAFELRVGREPGLAADFESFAKARDAVAGTLRNGARDTPSSILLWCGITAAAAALLLAWTQLSGPRTTRVSFDARILATSPSDSGFNELVGLDGDWLPAGMGFRDPSAPPPPTPVEYAEVVGAAFLAQALAAPLGGEEPKARAFVIGVEAERDCYATLWVFGDGREPEQLLPSADRARAKLDGGVLHLLPRVPVLLEDGAVDYAPGILTRRGVWYVLGLRGDMIEEGFLGGAETGADGKGSEARARALASNLEARGFAVRVGRVDAP